MRNLKFTRRWFGWLILAHVFTLLGGYLFLMMWNNWGLADAFKFVGFMFLMTLGLTVFGTALNWVSGD